MKIKTANFWEEVLKLAPNDAILLPLDGNEVYVWSPLYEIYQKMVERHPWLPTSIVAYSTKRDNCHKIQVSRKPLCFHVSYNSPNILVANYTHFSIWEEHRELKIYHPEVLEQHIKDRKIQNIIVPDFTDCKNQLDNLWDERYTLIRHS